MSAWDLFQITTVNGDMVGMAERAAQLLIQRIESPDSLPQRVTLAPRLVLRGTHAAPRG